MMIAVIVSSLSTMAQTAEKTVTLVTSGDGATKEEAVKQALRSAIEQTFGTFVSANTEVLDDEIIQDEIVTVSTGNITDYREINTLKNGDGSYSTTVEATVSIGKLTNFARSKGMSVELATGAFSMNMKIRELNKENEVQAIKDLQTKLRKMESEYNFFDYNLELSEPYLKGENYAVKVNITITPNMNLANFRNAIISTLKSLSLSEDEQAEYSRANIPFTRFAITEYDSDSDFLASMQKSAVDRGKSSKYSIIALRNTDTSFPLLYFPVLLLNNELKCSTEDNTGNYQGMMYKIDRYRGERVSPIDVVHTSSPIWPLYNFDPKYRKPEIEWYVYNLGTTIGAANLTRSKLYTLNEQFDFSLQDSNDPMGNPMLSGPAVLTYEIIYTKEHFSKINDISMKYRRPYYYEED